jgi:AcrR family transcriptional regulator
MPMRTRGWGGSPPATDEEAAARILEAAKTAIERDGAVNISDIAKQVGVTRQTVYRYYPSNDWLLMAAALDSAEGFLDRLADHVAGLHDPADAVVEGTLYALQALPDETYIRLAVTSERAMSFVVYFTSDESLSLAHSMLHRFEVDWEAEGFDEAAINELAEQILRTLQSFVTDPGHPPRSTKELRAYLQRWLGAAVRHRSCPDPKPTPRRRARGKRKT